jgi:pilus assembly protein Flp/PilA
VFSRMFVGLRVAIDLREEEGAAAVEYGLLVALVAAVILLVVKSLGSNVSNAFSSATLGW